ncbi:MAG: YwbE family protein [Candidatus Paceibacterota bacterium]|jgi:uncharacterized repeat protein (TIGR03833 family)
MNGQNREDVKIGQEVEVVLKEDQKTGKLTRGIVSEILTNSGFHPHGIKVRLEDGQVGRARNIVSPANSHSSTNL